MTRNLGSLKMPERLVARPLLLERLSAAPPGGVMLICAPAGAGKTLLLRTWAAGLGKGVAWVTVERGEREAQRFWLHVIDALGNTAGGELIERVTPAPSLYADAVVERLLSKLEQLGEPVVLVVDDLHELKSPDALKGLELMLSRLPPQLRVALATREDPDLGLHRLRLAGALSELRGADLRFSIDETRALLDAGGITVSESSVELLHERTEGWPAGLRLAAISLSGHPDPDRFVSEFSGSERTVAGYLVAEVLERQPPEVRDLLLRTSILDRVSGPLADALTGGTGGEAILQQLEDNNAFVMAVDAGRTWFRYHHLLADLLRLELRRSSPAIISSLHRAAAAWHEEHGHVVEAIDHLHAAGEWADAARVLVDNYFGLTAAGLGETLHARLGAFPASARGDGNLALALAMDTILHGDLDEAANYLDVARELASTVPPARRRLFAVYAAVIAVELSRRRGDLHEVQQAMRGVDAALAVKRSASEMPVPPDYRALTLMNLGIAELWSARPEAARRHLDEALALARLIPRPFIEVGCLAHLALAAPLTGQRLPVTLELSEQALAIAEERGWGEEPMATAAFAIAAMALVRLGRFQEAEERLDSAEPSLRGLGEPVTEVVLHHTRGMLRFGQGRFEEALTAFARAQDLGRLLVREHIMLAELHDRVLQVRVRMGHVDYARRALARLRPRQREQAGMRIALAALKLAEDDPERAVEVLAPVIACSAPAVHQGWAQVEALILDASARDRLGERSAAHDSLERALDLAEPEGLILPFALWPSLELLERHRQHRTGHAMLLSTILDTMWGRARPLGGPPPVCDDLSDAELRVVRYLPSNLTAPEIASELFVSANTVRTHMRHIYTKLDVHWRNEAVTRARELGLVAPGDSGARIRPPRANHPKFVTTAHPRRREP
jgi:LuxR family transcriptional regulator, maltose regulon positive regulatory protein